jgi:hypothetical protein
MIKNIYLIFFIFFIILMNCRQTATNADFISPSIGKINVSITNVGSLPAECNVYWALVYPGESLSITSIVDYGIVPVSSSSVLITSNEFKNGNKYDFYCLIDVDANFSIYSPTSSGDATTYINNIVINGNKNFMLNFTNDFSFIP